VEVTSANAAFAAGIFDFLRKVNLLGTYTGLGTDFALI
jgi:hypothetical protein